MIASFSGRYAFLSNFSPHAITIDRTYPSVEHAFQAMKTTDHGMRQLIADALTPGAAKKLGRTVPLREGWDALRDEVMLHCLRTKFAPGSQLAAALVFTGDHVLMEGNTWGDRYWGVTVVGGEWIGENKLGKFLMLVRSERT